MCLGNISKDFAVNNLKETGPNGYVYDFLVDYESIGADDILHFCKCLMKNINVWIY